MLVAGPMLAAGDTVLHGLLGLARWAAAVVLLSLAVVSWILASLGFRLFVESVADFKSAAGVLAAFLVLTSYVYTSSIIFLVGVEVDELLRKGRLTR